MRRIAVGSALLMLLISGSVSLSRSPAEAAPAHAAASTANGAADGSGPAVWKRYDVKVERGAWQQVGVHTLPKGSTWTVSLQMTLNLDSATGSEIRGQNTSIGWVRKGWGGQSRAGSQDSTGASDNAIAVDNDARYQHLAEHSLSGGGPLEFRVKVGGHGTVNASLLVFKVIKGTPSSSCPPLIPVCAVLGIGAGLVEDAGGMVESAAQTMLGVVANSFLQAYLLLFRYSTTWWLDLSMTPQALVGAVDSGFRGTVMFVAAFVMVLGLLSAAIQTVWRRDGSVVADTAAGLFKAILVIFGAWSVLGVLWTLADQLTAALAPSAQNIDVDPVLGLSTALASATTGLPVLVIIISAIGFIASLGMALLMVFRLASAVILFLLLPIAAAGAPGTSTRGWLPKVTGWLLALIFLRPTVAAIYRIGFEFMAGGNDPANATLIQQMGQAGDPDSIPAAAADGLMTMLVGVMTLLVATFALPVLLRLFSWMFGSPAGVGGAGLALASLGAQGALMRRSSNAASQSAQLDDALAPQPGPPAPGGGGSQAGAGLPTGPSGSGPVSGAAASSAGGGSAAAAGTATGAGAGAGAAGGAAAGAAGGPPGMVAGAVIAGGVMQLAGAARSAAEQSAGEGQET